MKPYPHHYSVSARGSVAGPVPVAALGLPELQTAPPPEFDGPGGVWSPESLLVGSVVDCFVLTFRGVARAAHFPWDSLECEVTGTLERIDGVSRFSRFATKARLTVPSGSDAEKAHQLLERAEKACLIANSLNAERLLEADVTAAAS